MKSIYVKIMARRLKAVAIVYAGSIESYCGSLAKPISIGCPKFCNTTGCNITARDAFEVGALKQNASIVFNVWKTRGESTSGKCSRDLEFFCLPLAFLSGYCYKLSAL